MVLDDLDQALLRLLLEDARLSHRELARRTKSTAPTVGARIHRMEELGIIQGYTVRLDPERFGGAPQPDLASATVACHTCKKESAEPVWARVGGRPHPFCCTTCRRDFRKRHERMQHGGLDAP